MIQTNHRYKTLYEENAGLIAAMFIYLDGKAWAQMQKEQKNSPNRLCRHRCPEEWRFSVLFKKT